MTATNHALTGAIVGLVVSNPIAAVLLAFLSHFALDALPHYGPSKPNIGSKNFRNYLLVDVCLCALLVALLLMSTPHLWLLASVCAFVAALPDAMWLPDFLRAKQGKKSRPITRRYWLVRMHAWVQWYQKPFGALVEVVWVVGAIAVLVALVR